MKSEDSPNCKDGDVALNSMLCTYIIRKPAVHQQKKSSDPRLRNNYQNPGPGSRVTLASDAARCSKYKAETLEILMIQVKIDHDI